MFNPYLTKEVVIKKIYKDSDTVNRYSLSFKKISDQKAFEFTPGQIIELSIPGYNEAPFAICSSTVKTDAFELTIRKAGSLTGAMHSMKVGDTLGVRGPFGHGFPIDKIQGRNLLILAGGIGFIPFRSLLQTIGDDKSMFDGKMQIFYGSKTKEELLFETEYEKWSRFVEIYVTLDEGRKQKITKSVSCDIGLITKLFDKVKVNENSVAFICGPPVMCKFIIKELKKLKFKDDEIYISLERKMECGVGVCEHCAIGSKFVCKDGPVFSWAEIKNIRGAV